MTAPRDTAGGFVVPCGHPALPGHFPHAPVLPGAVLLDHVAAAIVAAQPGRRLAGFPSVRFLRPVRGGDRVEVAFDGVRFRCSVDGQAVASGTAALA